MRYGLRVGGWRIGERRRRQRGCADGIFRSGQARARHCRAVGIVASAVALVHEIGPGYGELGEGSAPRSSDKGSVLPQFIEGKSRTQHSNMLREYTPEITTRKVDTLLKDSDFWTPTVSELQTGLGAPLADVKDA
jgi:hypothetical protein